MNEISEETAFNILPPTNKNIKTNYSKNRIDDVVNSWLEYMDLGKFIIKKSDKEIIRLFIDRQSIADVGFGVSQILPIIVEGSIMKQYQGAPYWYSKNPFIDPPITNSHYLKISYGKIKEKFQRIINKNFNEVEINKSKGNTRISELRFIDLSKCKDAFLKYIETQFYELENCILILGMERETGNIIVEMNGQNAILQAINNPPSDCTNIVVKILQSSGNDSELFPNKAACNSLNDSFKDEIKGKHLSDSEKIEIMLKYGGEFASRNHYEKNAQLTRNNPKRTVFENKTNRCAISIDREHGGIELFMKRKHSLKFKNGKKSSFIHKGEYSFSGDKIKSAEPYNHIIYD